MVTMIILLILASLAIVIGTTWRPQMPKRCPACGSLCPGRARKCIHCHTWFPGLRIAAMLLVLCGLGGMVQPVQAESLQLLDCPAVHFFQDPCEETEAAAPQPVVPPAPVSQPEEPLFPRETLAPDTPPLMVKVFNDPSDANIDAYLAWHERKAERLKLVQAKLKERALLRRQPLLEGTK